MRLGRKLVSIDEDKDGVNLVFDDGQSERFGLWLCALLLPPTELQQVRIIRVSRAP